MAKPPTYPGSVVAIFFAGATPGSFLRPCGLNSHTVSFTSSSTEVTVPDCDNPELPAWVERQSDGLSMSASGSGVASPDVIDDIWDIYTSQESVNARVYIGAPNDTAKGKYWAGKFLVTSFEVTGERKQKAQISISIASDGVITLADVTA